MPNRYQRVKFGIAVEQLERILDLPHNVTIQSIHVEHDPLNVWVTLESGYFDEAAPFSESPIIHLVQVNEDVVTAQKAAVAKQSSRR